MTLTLEAQIAHAVIAAHNETENQILDIFLHDIICYLTSPIKVAGAFDKRIIDGIYQSKLSGEVHEYRNSYQNIMQKNKSLSKIKKLINLLSHYKKDKILHFDSKLISVAKNKLDIGRRHRYVTYARKHAPSSEIDAAFDIIDRYLKKNEFNLSIDWQPLKQHVVRNYYEPKFYGPVVTGALTNCLTRAIANKAQKMHLDHFVVVHGKMSSFALSEPVFEYGYHRNNVKLINYGTFKSDSNYGMFSKLTPIKLTKRDRVGQYNLRKCVYVPTSLSGLYTYGPYRALTDKKYLQIRSDIKQIFPNLKVKIHPKERKELTSSEGETVTGTIKDALMKFDVFVFDYVSTALFEVIHSDKIIVFIDFNIRNLDSEFLEDFRKVVHYVHAKDLNKITMCQLGDIAINIELREKFLEKYSGSHEKLIRQLKSIIIE